MSYKKMTLGELLELSNLAFSEYYRLATVPRGDWHPGMKFPALDKATKKLNAINAEIERRLNG